MELSRKDKFGTTKVKAKKWPKVILVTVFALMLGTTSAFAMKPELKDSITKLILNYAYKEDINTELTEKKNSLLGQLKVDLQEMITKTSEELNDSKTKVIEAEKKEIENHYKQELKEVNDTKNNAVKTVTENMKNEANSTSEKQKLEITEAIEAVIPK
jgi:TRAP-type C4-dicarboxylate transport system substrate-binding protein